MLDNCQLHSGRLNNVLGYNLTVTGSDGKHDTVTSQVRIDSEVAVEQTVILSWRQHSLVRPQPQYEHLHPRLPPGLRDGGALQVRGVRV